MDEQNRPQSHPRLISASSPDYEEDTPESPRGCFQHWFPSPPAPAAGLSGLKLFPDWSHSSAKWHNNKYNGILSNHPTPSFSH